MIPIYCKTDVPIPRIYTHYINKSTYALIVYTLYDSETGFGEEYCSTACIEDGYDYTKNVDVVMEYIPIEAQEIIINFGKFYFNDVLYAINDKIETATMTAKKIKYYMQKI